MAATAKRKKKVVDLGALPPSKDQKLDDIFSVRPKRPENPEAEELTPSVAASHAQVVDVAPSASVTSAAQDADLSSPGVAVEMETTKDAEQDSNNASHGSAADGNAFNQADEEADEEATGVSPPLAALASSSAVKHSTESDDSVQQPTPANVLPEAAARPAGKDGSEQTPFIAKLPADNHASEHKLSDVEPMGVSPSRHSIAMGAPKQYKYHPVLK